MAINDIIYNESDSFIIETTGINSPIADILFIPTAFSMEIVGTNGLINDILFDPSMTYEIPKILVTDFSFL